VPHASTGDRISIDPAICHGKPCIRGLRYPVENLLELLAGGMTIDEILADYEDIERDDVLAALAYARPDWTPNIRSTCLLVIGRQIIVTKDADFVQSFLVTGRPSRLLLISTGNIANSELERLMRAHFGRIVQASTQHRFVELGRDALVIHE